MGSWVVYVIMAAADIYAILVSFVSTSDRYKSRDSLLRLLYVCKDDPTSIYL